MRFVVDHDTVLKLATGADLFLKSCSLVLVALVCLLLLFSHGPLLPKIPYLAVCTSVGALIYYWDHEASGTMLSIFPDGRVSWVTRSGQAGSAMLCSGHWLSPRYCLVTAGQAHGVHRFLVCRSLQTHQGFRILRTWLRLGLPRPAHGSDGDT